MSWVRAIVCFVAPPLAVADQGIKPFLLTCVLTVLGWLPGVIVALVYCSRPKGELAFPA